MTGYFFILIYYFYFMSMFWLKPLQCVYLVKAGLKPTPIEYTGTYPEIPGQYIKALSYQKDK